MRTAKDAVMEKERAVGECEIQGAALCVIRGVTPIFYENTDQWFQNYGLQLLFAIDLVVYAQ
jgi:hypothetical protein